MPERRPQRSDAALRYRSLYRDPRWKRRRDAQLSAHPHCKMCKAHGEKVKAVIVDHVKPHRGDVVLFFDGELQSLCKPHHDKWKQAIENSNRSACDVSGMPTDPDHPWAR